MRSGILTIVLALVALCAPAFAYDWSTNPGDGSPENPYQIWDPNQLVSIGTDSTLLNKHFILTADLNLSAFTGIQFNRIGGYSIPFTGVFNGRGFTISNLTYISRTTGRVGLFAAASGAEIMNLRIEHANIEAEAQGGGLAGSVTNCTISNCHSGGVVTGPSSIGGLIGYSSGSIIVNCTTNGTVTGVQRAGGLIGGITGGQIKYCNSSADVSGKSPSNNQSLGGLVGYSNICIIVDSSASGIVSAANSRNIGGFVGTIVSETISRSFAFGNVACATGDYIGGFAGSCGGGNYPPIFVDCYASGNVTGKNNVGGFAGSLMTTTLDPGRLTRCYATGLVQGSTNKGGLIGSCNIAKSVLQNTYWDMAATQTTDGIGSIDPDPAGVTGLETALMKQQASFTGWDFLGESANGQNEIWRMCADGVDYPRLSWEFAQNGDFACADGTDLTDLLALADEWLTDKTAAPTTFNYACDANADEKINLQDLTALSNGL